jgi:DNA repair exonuclease SbcCD ATPase subunit
MKTVIFKHLAVRDFKGIDEKEIDFSNGVTVIYGQNYSGKTSLLDALYWVLFGKSLTGDTRFGVMPIGNADAIPSVTLALEVDGEPHTLQRQLISNGSKTDCVIDSVPVKVTDYDAWVSDSIMQMDKFKLFSNPVYFASLPWQEQRALFTGFFENLPREDVLNAMYRDDKPVLAEFRTRVEKQRPEDIIEAMKREIKDVETQKAKDQGAAEYLAKEISAAGAVDTAALEAERAELTKQIDEATQIAKNGEDARQKIDTERRTLRQLEQEAEDIDYQIRTKNREKETKIAGIRQLISSTEASIQRKANEWKAAEACEVCTICPTCGQGFPADRVSAGQETKTKMIADIEESGKALRIELDDCKTNLAEAQQIEFPELTRALVEKENAAKKQREVVAQMESACAPAAVSVSGMTIRLAQIAAEITAASKAAEKKTERDELISKIQKAACAIEIRERVKKDAETFIQYRALATVEAANASFERVRIELYDYPKNGEPKPTFRLLYNGVNFQDISSTERVLVGIEINETLKWAFNVSLPTIIDGFESYLSISFDKLPKQSIVSVAILDGEFIVKHI